MHTPLSGPRAILPLGNKSLCWTSISLPQWGLRATPPLDAEALCRPLISSHECYVYPASYPELGSQPRPESVKLRFIMVVMRSTCVCHMLSTHDVAPSACPGRVLGGVMERCEQQVARRPHSRQRPLRQLAFRLTAMDWSIGRPTTSTLTPSGRYGHETVAPDRPSPSCIG